MPNPVMVNADTVMSLGGEVKKTVVKLKALPKHKKGGLVDVTYEATSDEIYATIKLVPSDWHSTMVASGEWTRQFYGSDGEKVGSASAGKLIKTTDSKEMTLLCLDRIFGAGKWQPDGGKNWKILKLK